MSLVCHSVMHGFWNIFNISWSWHSLETIFMYCYKINNGRRGSESFWYKRWSTLCVTNIFSRDDVDCTQFPRAELDEAHLHDRVSSNHDEDWNDWEILRVCSMSSFAHYTADISRLGPLIALLCCMGSERSAEIEDRLLIATEMRNLAPFSSQVSLTLSPISGNRNWGPRWGPLRSGRRGGIKRWVGCRSCKSLKIMLAFLYGQIPFTREEGPERLRWFECLSFTWSTWRLFQEIMWNGVNHELRGTVWTNLQIRLAIRKGIWGVLTHQNLGSIVEHGSGQQMFKPSSCVVVKDELEEIHWKWVTLCNRLAIPHFKSHYNTVVQWT